MFEYTEALFIDSKEAMHLERFCSGMDGDSASKHTHDFLELVYIENGSMVHIIDNKPYKLSQGTTLIFFPGQTHSYFSLSDFGISFINICVRMSVAEKLISPILKQQETDFFPANFYQTLNSIVTTNPFIFMDENVQKFNNISVSNMLDIYSNKIDNYNQLLVEGLSTLLSFYFKEIIENIFILENLVNMPERILEALEANYMSENVSLQSLATNMNYDSGYLSKALKNYCGLTITDYIQKKRMDMAKHLLWETDMSIDDISKFVGYTNKYFFYKLFKKQYAITPSESRTRYKKITQRFVNN